MRCEKHKLKIGETGTYEDVKCTVTEIINPILIEVEGRFGRDYYWDFRYKSWLHRLFRIKSHFLAERAYVTRKQISEWNFKREKKSCH